MRESLDTFCAREGLEHLLSQWDSEKNRTDTPDSVSYGSNRKVWWRCERGHSWQAAVYTRTGGRAGCPICAGKVPQAGENDLATRRTDLARQWHPTRNSGLRPDQVLPGSHRMVWWVCPQGHEWRAQIKSRVSGCGCPVCANREVRPTQNDLASQFPALAAQWHPTKNGAIPPDAIPPGTARKVWWRCAQGHAWKAGVSSRTSGSGCPVCAGKQVIPGENDLSSIFPSVAAQWHPEEKRGACPGAGNTQFQPEGLVDL